MSNEGPQKSDFKEAAKLPDCGEQCAPRHGDQAEDPEVEELFALRRKVAELEARPQTSQELLIDELRTDRAALRSELLAERARFDAAWMKWTGEGEFNGQQLAAAQAEITRLRGVLEEYHPMHRGDCRRGFPSALRPCTCGLFDAIGPLSDREIQKRLDHPELGPWDPASIRERRR